MRKVWTFLISIILTITVIPVIIDIAPPAASATIWYVDDVPGGSPSEDFISIQDAVNASQPGDTVFVWNGTYYEDVEINKTLNLIGESRDNVIINGSDSNAAIYINNADYVNITGFTVEDSGTGISLYLSNNSLVKNNRAVRNKYGIIINSCNNSVVQDNIASNNSNYHGIYLLQSTNITVKNNNCFGNQGHGIYIYQESYNNIIIENNCSYNANGIKVGSLSSDNYLVGNNFSSNLQYGIWDSSDGGNIYLNMTIHNCWTGIRVGTSTQDVLILNSTIENSSGYDISVVGSNTYFTTINTTFNKTKSYFGGASTNLLIVKWYLHVNVIDYLGNPVSNARVDIEDNVNSTYNHTFITDANGNLRWLKITEYIEQDTDGNNIGEKTFHTPHKIVAWNDTLVGYAKPLMIKSKIVIIVLYNGTLMNLEPGWNLISLPRPQLNTNLQSVLQSIEGQYDSVQWYNITDNNDPWKHNHISKPFYLNDLKKINHTMGFWLHIIDSEGTTLVIIGDELTFNQDISLYPGWNLVGFPSKTNKTRDVGLGALSFGSDVDSIWTYNSTIDKWIELNDGMDYFEIGLGYWVHSKVTNVWNVPL